MNADRQIDLPEADQIDVAVEVFRMLSDATRVSLLWCLLDREHSVGELADAVGKPPAAVSQHLAKLRLAHLVQTRREGNVIFYRLDSEHARQMVIDGIHHAEHQGTEVPAHHRQQNVIPIAGDGHGG